jgi:hypothetical protein
VREVPVDFPSIPEVAPHITSPIGIPAKLMGRMAHCRIKLSQSGGRGAALLVALCFCFLRLLTDCSNPGSSTTPPPPLIVVTISPLQATTLAGGNQQFMASVTGTANTAVTWTVSGTGCTGAACGTVSSSGFYTAPSAVPSPATVTVTASSEAVPTQSASAVVTISVPPPIIVTISPSQVTTPAGGSQQFTASVTGTADATVNWTVSGSGCTGTACGTISSSGFYTAPPTVPSPATVAVTATTLATPAQAASAEVTIVAPPTVTYYLATAEDGGNDSNDGLSAITPWLSPHHAVNCGDVILAKANDAYSSSNFTYGSWGTVTCSAGNNVAWLTCETFDGCKINSESGLLIDQSYWGVQGWEVHAAGNPLTPTITQAACFAAAPNYATPVEIHHIIFANDIANGCQNNGLTSWSQGTASVDYLAIVGNIAYNAAQGNTACFSGISVYQPAESDSLPGTHIYVAGNFSWGNFDANPCSGGTPTDGEGIILDTFDGNGNSGGLPSPYRAQAVVDNNILVGNGAGGLNVAFNDHGTSPFAAIYLRHNTMWGNNADTNQNSAYCGGLLLYEAFNVQAFNNLAATGRQFGCGANPVYAYFVGSSATTTNAIYDSWGYSAYGTNDSINSSTGFSYGPDDTFGVDPVFSNPVTPGAPDCGGATGVPDCMAPVIANFTPTAAGTSGYGYQRPSDTPDNDPLFPQWLCNVNLPSGLITMGCPAAAPATTAKQ